MNMGLDKMLEQITKDSNAVFTQLIETAKLHEGSIVVLGCSTSEVGGERIGTHSSMDVAAAIYDGFFDLLKEKGIFLAAQCCEHLNRALVIERELAIKPISRSSMLFPSRKQAAAALPLTPALTIPFLSSIYRLTRVWISAVR